MIRCVIGSNYGDEGKGLAVDYLSLRAGKTLVVRHNGGAQSGHTVERPGKRFVFHELSSGSFCGADTYWAGSFLPDLYKLGEEADDFLALTGVMPRIHASSECCVTTVDDVLINLLLESVRGSNRHGSCGMGINEAQLRKDAGFGLPLGTLCRMEEEEIRSALVYLRTHYTRKRLEGLGLDGAPENEYGEMLRDGVVLERYAEEIFHNLRRIRIDGDPAALFRSYDQVLFENGQGLRLDAEFRESLPHVTASRTGLVNAVRLLDDCGLRLDEAVYVTRTYLTKHGAGPLKNECPEFPAERNIVDRTNVPNPWQGALRYAKWEDPEDLLGVIRSDLRSCPYPVSASLFVTHLNETGGRMVFRNEEPEIGRFAEELPPGLFDRLYLSSSRYSSDVVRSELRRPVSGEECVPENPSAGLSG